MSRSLIRTMLLAGATFSLAACGGGGGSGGGSGLVSTPTPPPPPTPTPYNLVKIFPDVTISTDFAVLGLEASAYNLPASSLTKTGFSVRYDAASSAYVLDFPSTQPGSFHAFDSNSRFWNGSLTDPSTVGGIQPIVVDVFKPSPANPDFQLSYTTFAQYSYDSSPFGVVAFGTPTPGSAVPSTGSATYNAYVAGTTNDSVYYIRGSATLNFNFGAGTLSGQFNPLLYDLTGGALSLGQYNFQNTVFGVGSTAFSGGLRHSSNNLTGMFDGLFTGPNAQELMARWTASYVNPDTQKNGEMFGVWVGKRP